MLCLRGNWKIPVPEPNAEDLKGEAQAADYYHPTILFRSPTLRDDLEDAQAAMIWRILPQWRPE